MVFFKRWRRVKELCGIIALVCTYVLLIVLKRRIFFNASKKILIVLSPKYFKKYSFHSVGDKRRLQTCWQINEVNIMLWNALTDYQNICGTKFSRYLFSARSEFGIFIVFFNEVFSSYVIRVNCVSYTSCCQSVCSPFGSATPHATTLFFLTWVTRRTVMFVLVRTLKS